MISTWCHPDTSRRLLAVLVVSVRVTSIVGLFALPCRLLAQQTNAERILSGRDTPSHDYDLIHQRIEVANFDWDATAFDGKVTTTVVSRRPGLDSIVMDMGRRLAVRSVTLESRSRGR